MQRGDLRGLVWRSSFPDKGVVQQTALRYWCFHYLKRIGETFFLHRLAPVQTRRFIAQHDTNALQSACVTN